MVTALSTNTKLETFYIDSLGNPYRDLIEQASFIAEVSTVCVLRYLVENQPLLYSSTIPDQRSVRDNPTSPRRENMNIYRD